MWYNRDLDRQKQIMKAKILITSIENMRLFQGKFPTKRWGFCEIVRKITIEPCPHGLYKHYGYTMIDGKKIRVTSSDSILFELSL